MFKVWDLWNKDFLYYKRSWISIPCGLRERTQVIRLDSKGLCPLNHHTDLEFLIKIKTKDFSMVCLFLQIISLFYTSNSVLFSQYFLNGLKLSSCFLVLISQSSNKISGIWRVLMTAMGGSCLKVLLLKGRHISTQLFDPHLSRAAMGQNLCQKNTVLGKNTRFFSMSYETCFGWICECLGSFHCHKSIKISSESVFHQVIKIWKYLTISFLQVNDIEFTAAVIDYWQKLNYIDPRDDF